MQFWDAPERLHEIWTSPQGLILSAISNRASVRPTKRDGRQFILLSFTQTGDLRVNAYVNEDNFVERVESYFGHPVLGDTFVETFYYAYRDWDGVKFPTRIVQYKDRLPVLDLYVTNVKPNGPVDIRVPDSVLKGRITINVDKLADGVWYLKGGSHHSVAIEMKDYIIVVEAPLNDEQSLAVIQAIKKIIPAKKPIKYVVNTHHHFDWAGGIRSYAANGATIITHEINKAFYYKTTAAVRSLKPDLLAKLRKRPIFQTVNDNMVLNDGSRAVELYSILDNDHDEGLIMVYLRKDKLLIESDAFIPSDENAPKPSVPNPFSVNLYNNIRRLNLDVQRIVPLQGNVVPYTDFLKEVDKMP